MMNKFRNLMTFGLILMVIAILTLSTSAENPYLPAWEHIPDGEPRVYNDRVYIYGSHDSQKNSTYCGYEYVSWSAPLDDLNNWEYHGESFNCGGLLYAPDAIKKGDKYYLYTYCLSHGNHVAKSDYPQGPFEPYAITRVGADPAVIVDDDGRVYAYWGYNNCYGAELDPDDMATILPGTQINDMIPSWRDSNDTEFHFYEAASMRKVEDKYVLVYCQKPPINSDPGVIHNNYRGRLSYAYSDGPLGPWTYGGPIIDNGGELLPNGKLSYPDGNNHGGMIEINGKWHIFYHRMSNQSEFSRQAMVEPIDVKVINGKVVIDQVEMTSQGFEADGLNAYKKYSASIVCYLTEGAYVTTAYEDNKNYNPITNLRNGSVAGVKYINFGTGANTDEFINLSLDILPKGAQGEIEVRLDNPDNGQLIGTIGVQSGAAQEYFTLSQPMENVVGKHAVYFVFSSESSGEICEINNFEFSKENALFKETFDKELDYWNIIAGTSYMANDKLVIKENSSIASKLGKNWMNYSFSTVIDVMQGQGDIRFRWSDANNYYSVTIDQSKITLWSSLYGQTTKLAEKSYEMESGKPQKIAITCVDDEIIINVNNNPKIIESNSHHKNGGIGYATKAGKIEVSYVQVAKMDKKQNLQINSIFIDEQIFEGFNPNVDNYEIEVEDASIIPTVTANSTDKTVSISVAQAQEIPGAAIVRFVKDGNIQEYVISFYTMQGSRSDFANQLPDGWSVINPANDSTDGSLEYSAAGTTIVTGALDLPKAKNMLQMDRPLVGNWIIDAKIDLNEAIKQGYQQYGIVIYIDDKNLIRFNHESNTSGQANMQILWWADGSWKTNGVSQKSQGTSHYMRLKKTGEYYQALFSTDGITYTNIHTIQTDGRFEENAKLMIYATRQSAGNSQYKATVEYVDIIPVSGNIEISQDQKDVETAATIAGNHIVLPASSVVDPSDMAQLATTQLQNNSDISRLGVRLEVILLDAHYRLKISKGSSTYTVNPFTIVVEYDFESLSALIDKVEALTKTNYTTASWQKLEYALDEASLINENTDIFSISKSYKQLLAAVEALEEVNNINQVISVKGVNEGGYTNIDTIEIVIAQDIGMKLERLAILKNGEEIDVYLNNDSDRLKQAGYSTDEKTVEADDNIEQQEKNEINDDSKAVTLNLDVVDENYIMVLDMTKSNYMDGKYQLVADFAGQNRSFRFTFDKTIPEITYDDKSGKITVSDENLDEVTVNGTIMPHSFVISGKGKFNIIAIDKAGNKNMLEVELKNNPDLPVDPPIGPPINPPVKPSDESREPTTSSSSQGSSRADVSSNIVGKNSDQNTVLHKLNDREAEILINTALNEAIQKAKDTKKITVEAVLTTVNISSVPPTFFSLFITRAQNLSQQNNLTIIPKIQMDIRQGNKVISRLTIYPKDHNDTESLQMELKISNKKIENRFEKYFENPIVALDIESQNLVNTKVEVAALLDFKRFDTKNLCIYQYDKTLNTYTKLTSSGLRVDANGYIRFTVNSAGTFIISSGDLIRKIGN